MFSVAFISYYSIRTLKSYFLYAKIFLNFVLGILHFPLLYILTPFSFSSSEIFWYLSRAFFAFFCLLQKDFDIFHMLLFEFFLCFSDNIYLPFLYINKKKFIKYFISYISIFLNFLHQNLPHQNFLH